MDSSSVRQPIFRVLVVDDNPDVTTTTSMLLRTSGFETSIAHNGSDALALVEKHRPDVVLLDLSMPKMSGIDACKLIRQLPLTTQPVVIAMTGYGADEDVQHCLDCGFDGHSVKGLPFAELQIKIATLLARKSGPVS